MAIQTPKDKTTKLRTQTQITPEQYKRLKAEVAAPYRVLRKFVYAICGASGFIGAVVFLAQLAAGREINSAFPNFALQIGVVALMVWLFKLENKAEGK